MSALYVQIIFALQESPFIGSECSVPFIKKPITCKFINVNMLEHMDDRSAKERFGNGLVIFRAPVTVYINVVSRVKARLRYPFHVMYR